MNGGRGGGGFEAVSGGLYWKLYFTKIVLVFIKEGPPLLQLTLIIVETVW